MTLEAAIPRSVLSDQVKDRLLQAILAGRYPPGARIVETRVARELGTSQAPVREALRDLEALGVVETTAFRGARVRRPSADELLEGLAIRAVLESLAARIAIPRLTDEDLCVLAGHVWEMRRAAEAGDLHAEATADAAFHGGIIALSGNATLLRVWKTLEPFSRTYITMVVSGADRRRIAELHAPVLAALQRRDATVAESVIHDHFTDTAAMLTRLWASAAPSAPGEPALRSAPPPAVAAAPPAVAAAAHRAAPPPAPPPRERTR